MSGDFIRVANTKEIQPSTMKYFDFAGERVCIVNIDGNYYAIGNVCTHMGEPLDEDSLERYDVKCPWPSSKFNIRTENVTNPSAQEPVASFEVRG